MEIINIEKLNGQSRIVLTGRDRNVRAVAKHLQARLYYLPNEYDYYEDYPICIKRLQELIADDDCVVAVTTQSAEFLDCLLESDMDFVLATVRQYDHDGAGVCRIRVLSKNEALENRHNFNMELRK